MNLRKLKAKATFLIVLIVFSAPSVLGIKVADQDDSSFESAESSSSRHDDVVIPIPADVQRLEVEQEDNQPMCNDDCTDKVCAGILGTSAVLVCFGVIAGGFILAASLGSVQPQLCPDICKNNPGYYAPINGTSLYAYVSCNGTIVSDPRKRGLHPAVIYLVAAGGSKSTPKPRTPYKNGYICEEAAFLALKTAMHEVESTSAPEITSLPDLVEGIVTKE